jgi:tetratricopeptide (TPR) repeat protein
MAGRAAEARDQRLLRAVLAWRAGRLAEAEAECRRLLAAAPAFAPALLLLGMLAARTGRAALAIPLLRKALARDPQSVEARTELALLLLREQGDAVAAAALCEAAVRLAPEQAGTHNALGLCYLAQRRLAEAATAFTRAAALDPAQATAPFNLGLVRQMQGEDEAAAAQYRAALRLAPAHAEAEARLGQVRLALGEPAAAACFARAAARPAESTQSALRIAEILVESGQAEAAETVLCRALVADPGAAMAEVALGRIAQQRGRFAEATACFSRALGLRPDLPEAFLGLAVSRRLTEADRPLVMRMEAALRRGGEGDVSPLHYALGKAYDDLGDPARAMRQYDTANRLRRAALFRAGRALDRERHAEAITQIIARFTPDLLARHAGEGSADETPVLIVGMIRSGTTLVEQILTSHPRIGAGGELRFWGERARLALGEVDATALSRLALRYGGLLRALAPGAARVTDKMPTNFLALGLIRLALPRARIIHCRRDPLDTCLSIYRTAYDSAPDFAHDPETIMFYYEQYTRLMAHWRAVLPAERLLDVRYEELVAEPERVSRQMVAFCGLEWDAACLRPERNARAVTTPSVWQARQPVYRSSVSRWQRYAPWLGAFSRLLPTSA